MATTATKWTTHTITEKNNDIWGSSRTITLRSTKSGRGKAAVERWQQRTNVDVFIDGLTPEKAIQAIQDASQGLEESYLDLEGYDGPVTVEVIGWSSDVAERHIKAAKAKDEADKQAKKRLTEAREAADKAKLLELAKRYPDLVQTVDAST
jgi:hypothetical protein